MSAEKREEGGPVKAPSLTSGPLKVKKVSPDQPNLHPGRGAGRPRSRRRAPVVVPDPVFQWQLIREADGPGLLALAEEYRRLGVPVPPDFVCLLPQNRRLSLYHLRRHHLSRLARRAGEDS